MYGANEFPNSGGPNPEVYLKRSKSENFIFWFWIELRRIQTHVRVTLFVNYLKGQTVPFSQPGELNLKHI